MGNDKKFEEIEEITLSFEDGNEEACEPLGLLELDGKDYIVLASNKEEEIYFFGYSEKENGEIELDNIEDEKIFEQLSDEFSKVLDEITVPGPDRRRHTRAKVASGTSVASGRSFSGSGGRPTSPGSHQAVSFTLLLSVFFMRLGDVAGALFPY